VRGKIMRFGMSAVTVLSLALCSPALATWVVILADPESGQVGIGQATCVSGIDLRSLSAVVVTEHGAATVQAYVDSSGIARATIRDELLAGTSPSEILNVLHDTDPQHETHQYCIVDTAGGSATYTGTTAQGLQYAGGATGEVGGLTYCVAGNVLTGAPVIAAAVQAITDTPGTLADRLMAAMEAARSMGGDGRCSCSQGNPTGCGSPPPSFDTAATVGYLVLARTGDTPACASCSGGEYYLDLNVAFQDSSDPDPVVLLQSLYDDFRDGHEGRPDAVASTIGLDPPALLPDGSSTSSMEVLLLDQDGAPIGLPIQSFGIGHAPGSDEVTTIGAPVDNGGGSYTVTLIAGAVPGVDRYSITADDGIRPVILMPAPTLPVGVPGEVTDLRFQNPTTLVWSAALAAVRYNVYRGALADIDCAYFGECRSAFDFDPTDLSFTDNFPPPPEGGFFYLVTSVDAGDNEGLLGSSSCGLRSNANPCP